MRRRLQRGASRLWSLTKAALYTHVRVRTVLRWILKGQLPAWRAGGRYYVRPEDLRGRGKHGAKYTAG